MSNLGKISVGDGSSGGFAAVSLKLHNVHTYECRHTVGEPLNSLMKADAPTFQNWPHPPPPL